MSVSPHTDFSLARGARISNFLPYIEEDIARLERQITAEGLRKAEKRELGAEEALRLWHELSVLARLKRTWQTDIAIAQGYAQQNAKELDLGGTDG